MTYNLFNPKIIKNYAIYTSIYLKFYIDFSESSDFSDFLNLPIYSEISDSSENSDFHPHKKRAYP